MSENRTDNRMIKMAELWERTSVKGTRYFSGFMGDCQLLMFDAGERNHPTRPGETVYVWRLMLQERDPSRRPQQRTNNRERHTMRDRAQAAGRAMLEHAGRHVEPIPDGGDELPW